YPEAAMLLKRVAALFPHVAYAHYLLGIARMKWGLLFLAQQSLEKADELLPNHSEHLRSMGWLKVLLGNLEEGRKYLREAISRDLTNPNAYMDLAMSYFHYFDFAEGHKWLDIAKSLAPNNPLIQEQESIAKEVEQDFSHYSSKQLEKMRTEKLDPDIQREFRVSLVEHAMNDKHEVSKEEILEIEEEFRLQGIRGTLARSA
ncbi:MAG: hypothetical protein Greene101447_576, partial [Parcubacteria group bacterium Greene1014_47]